jgi:hypothetical protein
MTTRLFVSWVRRGAAAGIIEPDPIVGPFGGPATFQPSITLARDGVPQPAAIAGPELPILGPGAVVGIDGTAIVRTDPAPGAASVEDNYLPLVELARPDLPWLYTPAKQNAQNRLRPWIVLIAVQASKATFVPATPLPRVTVPESELPDLNDSWAWAHAQVTVENPADGAAALNAPFGGPTISRLLCPRRLLPDTSYIACIVPATLVGAQAGLGLPLDRGPAIAPAWTIGAGQDVTLPVYYSWTFTTGDDGDFKSLVQRLKGIPPDAIDGFGTRTIDISAPWVSDPQLGAGMTIELDGALGIGVDRQGTLTPDARAAFEERLTRLLNFPADLNPASSAGVSTLSAVAPPIYAARHAGQIRVPDTTNWLRSLNLDPRRRIAAAFGTQYVQEHQEFLMARAWDQLGAVREANRLRAFAELAATVADRMHVRHVQPLGPSALLSIAAPARTRVKVAATATLQATVATTPMPAGSATVAFSRFSRPLGPIGRRVFARERPTVIEQGIAGVVRMPPPHSALDGIAALEAPVVAGAKSDATLRMAARAWVNVTALEQAVTPAGDLTAVRQAIARSGTPGDPGGFGTGSSGAPVLRPLESVAPLDAGTIANAVKVALQPSIRIIRRLNDRVIVPDRFGAGATAAPVMACPDLPAPLALVLQQKDPDYLVPGLGNFPDDRVTLLVANTAFIEAFMAGANHEMNRELLWREYPTDQRGTPFRHFWPRPDGKPDIPPITSWPLTNALGDNGDVPGADVAKMVVLLVRGEVLRRYPRTIVYAAPGKVDGDHLTLDTSVAWTPPQFLIKLDAKTTAFAYPLTEPDVHSQLPDKAGWYFVFSEPVAGPRFNFDATPALNFQTWNDLDWGQVNPVRGFAVAGRDLGIVPPGEHDDGDAKWNNDACDLARIAFARPFRIAYHADELLARG